VGEAGKLAKGEEEVIVVVNGVGWGLLTEMGSARGAP